jgi:hypothetical protein
MIKIGGNYNVYNLLLYDGFYSKRLRVVGGEENIDKFKKQGNENKKKTKEYDWKNDEKETRKDGLAVFHALFNDGLSRV